MSNFTFLTEEQCFGSDRLDILEKRGTAAAITDFSILLGGIAKSNSSLEERTGFYWTKSSCGNGNDVYVANVDGYMGGYNISLRYGGARPALPFSSIGSIPTNYERK